MTVDENKFFREATLRICGNLEIDKALRETLLYIRDYIPADFMGFVIYLPDEECFETIAVASLSGSDTLPIKTPVPLGERKKLKINFRSPKITKTDWIRKNEVTAHLTKNFGWPDGSAIMIEMVLAGKRMGALTIINEKREPYTDDHVRLLKLLNEPFGIALTNSIRYRKVRELKNLLVDDKRYLLDELMHMSEQKIIGSDRGLKNVMASVGQVAPSNSPVLLLGETGVGKEIVAKAIHRSSPRKDGPFIKVNCGAITETLMDSELFGHEKGAFTGAIARKRGRFERAEGGSIFLDEIGELPPEAQVRLLRVLQDKEIERVGGESPVEVNCRVIAATHRNLEEMILKGKFREDLFFRLKVFPIEILPLRERKIDIPALVQHFMQKKSQELAISGNPTLAPFAIDNLLAYEWPGNIRELENAVERALIMYRDTPLTFSDLRRPVHSDSPPPTGYTMDTFPSFNEMIKTHITGALKISKGKIEGEKGAANLLNINPGTLRQKMRKLEIPFGRKAKGKYH